MKKRLSIFMFATLLIGFTSCDSGNPDSKDRAEEANKETIEDSDLKEDAEFAVEAAIGGMMEVQLGELAQNQATSQQVKDIANKLIEDHTKANQELKAIAQQKNITLPRTISSDQQDKLTDFREKTTENFDADYLDFLVDHHEKQIDKFEDQAENGNVPEIQNWAKEKLPNLENHLQMVKQARDEHKADGRNNAVNRGMEGDLDGTIKQ